MIRFDTNSKQYWKQVIVSRLRVNNKQTSINLIGVCNIVLLMNLY